jgi:GT2 family glycosyltransferase
VLYYGRIHPEKGIDLLLDAWRRLNLPAYQATLVLAGDPYPTPEGREYARRIAESAPAGVHFLGMQRDVVPLLHAADTVVLPAQWQEPFGRVVAEGLISGRPVVASRVGGIPEQLTGELAGLLFDAHDPAELAARLAGLRHWRRDDPGLGHRCAEQARERLSLRATTDGVQQQLSAAVQSRAERAARTRPRVPREKAAAVQQPESIAEPDTGGRAEPAAVTGPLSAAVVICAYTEQRWDLMRSAIASAQAQTVRPDQLVLVIDHNEALLERCRQEWPEHGQSAEPPVTVVANRYPGRLGSARNTGVELLTTEVVAFLDDDAAADPAWLETLLAVYREDGAAVAVGGAPQPRYLTRRPAWFPVEFNWVYGCHYAGLPEERALTRHLIGASMSVRVEALIKVGGFHSDNHDDMDLSHRVAGQFGPSAVVYEPRARVQHTVTPDRVTWGYFWRRCFNVNRGKVLAFADLGEAGNLTAELAFARQMAGRVADRLRRGLRGEPAAFGQAGAIVAGLGLAGLGHVVGTVDLRLGRTEPSATKGLE